jgi:DNA-directed RNA polymerase subunit RPC12/RpoP
MTIAIIIVAGLVLAGIIRALINEGAGDISQVLGWRVLLFSIALAMVGVAGVECVRWQLGYSSPTTATLLIDTIWVCLCGLLALIVCADVIYVKIHREDDVHVSEFATLGIAAALIGVGTIEGIRWKIGYPLPTRTTMVMDAIWAAMSAIGAGIGWVIYCVRKSRKPGVTLEQVLPESLGLSSPLAYPVIQDSAILKQEPLSSHYGDGASIDDDDRKMVDPDEEYEVRDDEVVQPSPRAKFQNAVREAEKAVRAGRCEDAAVIYEALGMVEKAKLLRSTGRATTMKNVNINVDLRAIVEALIEHGKTVTYECSSCGALLEFSGKSGEDELRACRHCGAQNDPIRINKIISDILQ